MTLSPRKEFQRIDDEKRYYWTIWTFQVYCFENSPVWDLKIPSEIATKIEKERNRVSDLHIWNHVQEKPLLSVLSTIKALQQ